MSIDSAYLVSVQEIVQAKQRLKGIASESPLVFNQRLSAQYQCKVWLKREDLQVVRSYKIRGAYNRMSQLSELERTDGIVCASAGNHAQGVAFSCNQLGIPGTIYMPNPTPRQKIRKVQSFGGKIVEIVLTGDSFDDAFEAAIAESQLKNKVFIHPFDDPAVIAGQGTVGMEILAESTSTIDFLFMAVGGGGLASGAGSYFRQLSPHTNLIGVEPAGAPAMYESIRQKKRIKLAQMDGFVDGAAVKRVGELTFDICRNILDEMLLVPEGNVCSHILQLYDEEAIVVEPAGALSIAALDQYAEQIRGKNVVCLISGGNNDIMRMEEIKERSLLHKGLKHYFLIRFPQRAGALKEFLIKVLGPKDDITHFEYSKKNNRETGPALVGIELDHAADYLSLIARMKAYKVDFQPVNDNQSLFNYLI